MAIPFCLLAAVVALRAIATLRPSSWLWGLDSLADRAPLWQAAGLVLFGLALIPAVGRRAGDLLEQAARPPRTISFGGAFLLLAAGLLLLRVDHTLLGDTQTYASSLERGVRAAGGAHREPLPQAIVAAAFETFARPNARPAREAFAALEIPLAGVCFLLAILLARRLAKRIEARAVIFASVLLGGGLVLFAGYCEFYAFALTAGLLFAWAGLRVLDAERGASLASFAFLLAALCHAQMLFAAPALAIVLAAAWRRGARAETLASLIVLPLAALGALALLRYPFAELGVEASRHGTFLPPLGARIARTAYSAFAPQHLVELVNVALLACPVLPALLSLRAPRDRASRSRDLFLVALALGPVLFAFAVNPQLGMVRDWDIFVLPVALASLCASSRAAPWFERAGRPGRALAGCMFLTILLHGLFGLAANHDNQAARERIRRVAANGGLFGPQSHGEVWRFLGSADLQAGEEAKAAESYLHSIAAYPDERMTYRLLAGIRMGQAVRLGRPVETGLARYHEEVARVAHRPAFLHFGGCFAAATLQRDDLALEEARRMVELEPEYPELLATYGDFLRRSGQVDAAREVYERALARDPNNPRARIGLGCLAGARGDRAALEAEVREALRRTPWSPHAQQFANLLAQPGALTPDRCLRTLYIR